MVPSCCSIVFTNNAWYVFNAYPLVLQVSDAKMVWVDRLGFDIHIYSPQNDVFEVRIPFPREVTDEKGAKSSFNGMSQLAWEVERNYCGLEFEKVKQVKKIASKVQWLEGKVQFWKLKSKLYGWSFNVKNLTALQHNSQAILYLARVKWRSTYKAWWPVVFSCFNKISTTCLVFHNFLSCLWVYHFVRWLSPLSFRIVNFDK